MRIGHGYDVHQLQAARKLVLGGVLIDFDKGLLGHSDADVVLHALCDGILGALGEGDIGRHFPDSSEQFKNIDSRILLRQVSELMRKRGFSIGNVDISIIAQQPKLAPHIAVMQKNIAADLQCNVKRVNVKATTTEGLGAIGREEGIATHAVVLLEHSQ